MEYEKQLQSLRSCVPIGYLSALKLLKQTNGDVGQAKQLFINNAVSVIVDKTGFSESDAKKYLLASDFDIGLVLEKIENKHLSLSEQIIKKYKEKPYVLSRIAGAVEESKQLKRDFWLEFDQLNKLDQESRCLLILTEWLDFLDWEGLDYAIYFHLDVVTEQLENELNLPEIALH